jgi:hypothetical protein
MIKYEHNSLVLDSSHTKEDQDAINDFVKNKVDEAFDAGFDEGVDEGIVIERLRIMDLVEEWFNNPDVDYDTFLEWVKP